nr:immunoglobulin heavy chain junction region [Mus musculus]MBK4190022.1 immunoglobulin heavy chain junction region [Mus musculus]
CARRSFYYEGPWYFDVW